MNELMNEPAYRSVHVEPTRILARNRSNKSLHNRHLFKINSIACSVEVSNLQIVHVRVA